MVEEFFSSEGVDPAESETGATAVDTVALAQKLQTRSRHREQRIDRSEDLNALAAQSSTAAA